MMKIAILGWGSLLWEPGEFLNEWITAWQYDGPQLYVEFSRISRKRGGALTLVIDETNGTSTKVAWCLSKRKLLEDAIADLRCREETTMANIAHVCLAEETSMSGSSYKEIIAWAKEKGIDAVVWTGLKSNFKKETGAPFSVEAAVAYLKRPDIDRQCAAQYVREAPDFVRTKLRTALQNKPGFMKHA